MGDQMAALSKNELLNALPSAEHRLMAAYLVDVDLQEDQTLYDAGDIIQDVYFPTTAIVSMMNVMRDGQMVEVASVGHQGMVGIRLFYEDDEAVARATCLVPGHAHKIAAEKFWPLVHEQPGIRHVIHQYAHACHFEVFQYAACNNLHTFPQRLARWLLRTEDRSNRTTFPLGTAKIAAVLNVSVPRVRDVLHHFRDRGVIDFRGEKLSITNRAALERLACECYERVQLELFKIGERRRMIQQTDAGSSRQSDAGA
jgi:CRP-like cAMP-binding protein